MFDFDRDGVEDILIGQYCADTCAQIQVFKRGDSRGGIEGYFGRADYYFTLDYPASFLATDIDASQAIAGSFVTESTASPVAL